MPIIIGLILIPFIIGIIMKSNLITTKKKTKILLNILLILIALIYIILCLIAKAEPFNFEDHYSLEYMIYTGEYLIHAIVIFICSPFMWIILVHFARMILRSIRLGKNATIKKDEEYMYYRGDLDKVSPGIIMFTSMFEMDLKKSISATILKLKLLEYIEEINGEYRYTNKDDSDLLESEKMILNLIRFNIFDKNEYENAIQKEALTNKYIVKNHGKMSQKIIKIVMAFCIPIVIFVFSMMLDEYTLKNYHIWPEGDGHSYINLEKSNDVRRLEKQVKDKNDYEHREMADGSIYYSYDIIRADKLKYGIVRKAFFLHILTIFSMWVAAASVLVAAYVGIRQIVYIKKGYIRTIKGNVLLNKAYALKNYLKEYSLIKNRTEKELVLWEYYLIYAVVLGVNEKIEEEIIDKYVKNIV